MTLQPRIPGSCKGKIKISKDFDVLPQDVIDSFTMQDSEGTSEKCPDARRRKNFNRSLQ